MSDHTESCNQLLNELRESGIRDETVLDVISRIPRERFIPHTLSGQAYANRALPIEANQTISQPYIVAIMTSALQLQGIEQILEIGTGSGYQTAILSQLCERVVTVERLEELSQSARAVLSQQGMNNIEYHVGDGTLGYQPLAPYDGIMVTAAGPSIPDTLWQQLKAGGRIVIPVGDEQSQELICRTKVNHSFQDEILCRCRFVKLIGSEGWTV